MIKVTFFKEDSLLVGFESNGHANSSEYGTDIVCAAVSVLLISVINTIKQHLDIKHDLKISDGYLKLEILKKDIKDDRLESVLQVAYIGIKSIVQEHSKYVNISTEDRRMTIC